VSDLAEVDPAVPQLLRDRSGVQRVTNIELFFDLPYVFAVTQLSASPGSRTPGTPPPPPADHSPSPHPEDSSG
jgi:hypothetical protein